MAKAVWISLALALAPFMLLAGCTSCVEGPPVSARGITDAPSAGGIRGYSMTILVTDGPGGPALPGAGVVVYYGSDSTSEWSGPRIEVSDEDVLIEPVNGTGTVESKTTERLMTAGDGRALARVPENRIVGIVVAKDGYTEEWLPAVATGTTEGAITVPLYRANLTVDMDAVWGPGSASSGVVTDSQYGWDPHEVAFGETPAANRGYAARIIEMRVTIEWTNGAMGSGDLGIGVGPPDDGPRYFQDGNDDATPGAKSEMAAIALRELAERGILGAPAIQVGAATDTAFVAPFGLPYTMHIEAIFDTARANLGACNMGGTQSDNDGAGVNVPGHGWIASIIGLTVGALVIGRRK